MSASNLSGRMPGPGVDLNQDYTGDDYDRAGCVASIAVTQHGYMLSIFAPNGARMESYSSVNRAEDVARMLREWCEGKVPRLPAPIKTPTESREAAQMIPPCYQHADVLTVTPSDGQRIGFGLLMPDGTKVRYSIPLDDARWMAEYLIQYRMNAQLQLAISSGSENRDGSPQDGQ